MWKLFELHSQIIHDESIDVSLFFQHFAHWFATSVSGFAVDTNEYRTVAFVTFLQGGSKLKGVRRHDTVVVVGGGHKRCWIFHTFLQIVQW